MLARCTPLARLLTAFALLLVCLPGYAADWDQFPQLEGRHHVAIKKRFDGPRYDDLRDCYRRFDSRVGAEYFGAMVDVTAEGGSRSRLENDAGPYASALFDAWREQKKLGDDAVLIVMGVRNRSYAIQPGPKWKKLGFEGKVIEDTVNASHFLKRQRRAKYVDAMCSLATAIDLRLANLEREMNERVAALQERLPALDDKLTALRKQVDQRFEGEPALGNHPFHDTLSSRLSVARERLDEAKSQVEDKPQEAVRLADEAEAVLQPVRADLESFNRDMVKLASIEKELAAVAAAIEQRPDRDWDEPQAAAKKLAECRQKADKLRALYEGKPQDLRDCQSAAEMHLEKADLHHYYLRSFLPQLAIALLMALLAALLLATFLRRRRALELLEADLRRWRRHIEAANKQVDALETQYPAYFASSTEPVERPSWEGDSAGLDQQAADAVDRVALLQSQGREILAEATALHAASHMLDAKRLERASRLLRNKPVALRMYAPYTSSADELLDALDTACEQARERIDDIAVVLRRLDSQTGPADEAAARATASVGRRAELGLPAEHLGAPLTEALNIWRPAKQLSATDPVRATATFEVSRLLLDEIGQRAERGNDAVQRVQGPLAELAEELNQKLRQFRFVGVAVAKLSFDPEAELDAAKRQAVDVVELVSQAREDDAWERLETLQADMDRIASRLEVVAEAREGVPTRIEALERRSTDLKSRLLKTRYVLRLMVPDNDSDLFRREAKRLSKYHARINRLPKLLSKPEEHYEAGRYFLASEEVGRIERFFEAADSLVADLQGIEEKVDQARAQCHQLLETCEPTLRALQMRVGKTPVDAELRALVAEQAVSFQLVRDKIRAEQAHWFDAREELLAMRKVLAFLRAEISSGESGWEDAESRRAYREAQVRIMSKRATSTAVANAGILESSSSWADSVATLEEAGGAA